jgi:glycosyltransferase involved in cell wall biosynthesis
MDTGASEKFEPLVTIIIPVYNGAKYLADAIDSAISQTYPNIEILVIDDGSTDNTKEVAARYHEKVKYIYQENSGVGAALNTGITKATGEYISWLSHDDIYHADKIASQVTILADINPELRDKTIIYSAFEQMNEDGHIYEKFEPQKKYKTVQLEHPYFPAIFGLVNGCTTLIPRRCFQEVGLFNVDLRYTQDIDMWFRLLPKVKVKFQPESTLISRKHKSQGTNDENPRKIKEQNDLYKNMVNKLTKTDMVEMSGSELQFLTDVLAFVYELKYVDAARYLEERIRKLHESSGRSIKTALKSFARKLLSISPYYRKLIQTQEQQQRINTKIDYLLARTEELNSEKDKLKKQ